MNIQLKKIISESLNKTKYKKDFSDEITNINKDIEVKKTIDPKHGDFFTNVAMKMAKIVKESPMDIADQIKSCMLSIKYEEIEKIETVKPGFINFYLKNIQKNSIIQEIVKKDSTLDVFKTDNPKKVHVEFVSANPTGPLHVGHGRGLIFGNTISNLLRAQGHKVFTEYYVNNIGKQIDILTLSIILIILKKKGNLNNEDIYQGTYLTDIASTLDTKFLNEIKLHESGLDECKNLDEYLVKIKSFGDLFNELKENITNIIIEKYIKNDLDTLNVSFSNWFFESELIKNNYVYTVLDDLKNKQLSYIKDGAVWFKSSKYGDEKDRVLVRANGALTYFATDIAYHINKLEKYDHVINVWGADHHGYVPRLTNALKALGYDTEKLSIYLIQFANLYRGDEKISMSTRKGEFITLKSLIDEIGTDAINYFYIDKKRDQHLDFDINTALSKDKDNPVYYIQYAHARIKKILYKIDNIKKHKFNPKSINNKKEQDLIKILNSYGEIYKNSAASLQPQLITNYLFKLSQSFHSYYASTKIIDDNIDYNRIYLLCAIQKILKDGLNLMNIKAPEDM